MPILVVDEDYLVTVHDLEVLRGNTAIVRYLQCAPSMMSWSIHTLLLQKWIDQDFIDGPHCIIIGHGIFYNDVTRLGLNVDL